MKKLLFLLLLFFSINFSSAQSYIGFLTDNYSGVHGVISNPANITDSRFKTDINLVGASILFANDYYGIKLSDATSGDFDLEEDASKNPSESNNIFGNVDVLGPAFMFNLDKKSSIAVFSRMRVNYNINNINGETYESISNDFDETQDFNVNEEDYYLTGNAWAEIGITYARTIYNKEQHFVKGGISLKYLQGLGNAYSSGKEVTIDYDADGSNLGGGVTTGSITTTGEVNYGHSDNIDGNFDDFDLEVIDGAKGFGVDLGFVYEYRPDFATYNSTDADGNIYGRKDKNKYKFKFGLSITDIGSINYKNGTAKTYDIANTVTEDDFENEENFEDVLNNLYREINSGSTTKAMLPTALHLNADWNMHKKFYLNLNADLSLTSNSKENTSRIANIASLTPRYESKGFSFYMPLSLIQGSGFQWGAGFRAGPLYVGSGSILSLLTSNDSKAADVYIGLKIPITQKSPKDKDGDGVTNKQDKCPKVAGAIENSGCPWEDTDGDTVLDKDDQCPEETGPVENNGCPWKDTDGDTVLDKDDQCPEEAGLPENNGCLYKDTDGDSIYDEEDKCPEEAGPTENNGCPWKDTDGDTILDKDDQCPNTAGTAANNGCPEVTETVQKTLNNYAKTILFNTGKTSIKVESTTALIEIIQILKEYPNAKFSVEGHTDSIGSAVNNQKLSEKRANSVKDFLIEKGIDFSRLSAVGYGETKPIADNMYKDGREQNRRVEINLVK